MIMDFLRDVIRKHSPYDMEFKFSRWHTDFFRFYHSQSNYNITKTDTRLSGTVIKDKRQSSFTLSNPTPADIEEAIHAAKEMTAILPPDPDFHSLEDNREQYAYPAGGNASPEVPLDSKIALLNKIARKAGSYDFHAFGSFISLNRNINILNSAGVDKLFLQTPVMLDIKAVSNKNMSTVIENFGGDDWSLFSEQDFIGRLENKIRIAQQEPVDCEPGEYEVILSPQALGEFLTMLTYCAYDSTLDTGLSFFQGQTGQKLFPESVTLLSDPLAPGMVKVPYNPDGHIARTVPIIEKGIFKNFIVSHYYAHKLNLEKNGSVGVEALALLPGNTPLDELISQVQNGLYISNLHYMNFINMKETSVTGLTRDGTFLIKNGKIAGLVDNLRFTDKLTSLVANITGIEDRQYTVPVSSNYGNFTINTSLMPHVKVSRLKISSSTHTI